MFNLSTLIDGFVLSKKADERAASTIELYKHTLGRLNAFLNNPSVSDVTSSDLDRFFVHLREAVSSSTGKRYSDRTREMHYVHVKAFFAWCVAEQYIERRPDHRIRRPRYDSKQTKPFTREEAQKLLTACDWAHVAEAKSPGYYAHRGPYRYRRPTAKRDRAIIHMLLSTGVRAGELCSLRFRDVNLENGEVYVHPAKTPHGRTTFMNPDCMKALWKYRHDANPDDWLFVSTDGQQMTVNGLRKVLKHLGTVAGIDDCHPHRFRHTCAHWLLEGGIDPWSLMRILGHTTMDMTNLYLKGLGKKETGEKHRKASGWGLR